MTIFPLYFASRILKALRIAKSDDEQIVGTIGELQTMGNGKYVLPVTDFNGVRYRITVETLT